MKNKTKCPSCGKMIGLNDQGKFKGHVIQKLKKTKEETGHTNACSMSFKNPADKQ